MVFAKVFNTYIVISCKNFTLDPRCSIVKMSRKGWKEIRVEGVGRNGYKMAHLLSVFRQEFALDGKDFSA